MRAAIVENDVVVNVIVVSDLSHPVGENQELISAELVDGLPVAERGWIRQPDGTFAAEEVLPLITHHP